MNNKGLDNFSLKWIAIITMVIDHIGAVFFPQISWLRLIGRLAFPIFCFLLVEGYHHTRDVKKYLIRLGLFALVSEIPFDLAFFPGQPFVAQNVFFTLALGVLAMYLIDMSRHNAIDPMKSNTLMEILIVLGVGIASVFLRTDYSILGILYIAIFYFYRGQNGLIALYLAAITFFSYNGVSSQMFAVLAMPLIACYNGKKGPSMKYLFYVFYPAHLLVIALVGWMMK